MDIEMLKNLRGDVDTGAAARRAKDDFRFAMGKVNLIAANHVDMFAMVRGSTTLGFAMPVPFNLEDKKCYIPVGLVKKEDPKMFVAVVCYRGGAPADILMINSSVFAKSRRPVKYDKRNNQYVLKLKDTNALSMRKFAFGAVIANLMSA